MKTPAECTTELKWMQDYPSRLIKNEIIRTIEGMQEAMRKLIDESERVVLAEKDDGVILIHLSNAISEAKAVLGGVIHEQNR